MKKITLPSWINPDDLITDCKTVEEFAHKYRKPDRFTGRGDAYVSAVMSTHKEELEQKGFTNISHHDTITGKHAVFVEPQNKIEWTPKSPSARQKTATT